jgi:AcrR family transcriptional regulator
LRGAKICVVRKVWDTLAGMDEEGSNCPAHRQEPGLRQRKKAETRDALSQAAIDLALREGPENVRVPDIAAQAGVSPRTFNNYFSSVPEAICAGPADRARGLGDALRGRPAGEPLAQAITHAMLGESSDRRDRVLVHMIMTTASLRGEMFKAVVAREISLAEAIAERVGSPAGDLFPRLLAASYCSATRVVTHRWMEDQDADFDTLLRHALDLVAPMAAKAEDVTKAQKTAA